MLEIVKPFMLSLAPFDEHDFENALPYFETEVIKKDDYFIKAGRISDRLGFVVDGLLRSFYTIKDKEATTFFLTPGSVAVALLSFLQLKPAIENIQALQASTLITIKKKHLEVLYHENWRWQQAGRVLIENYYILMEHRSISLQNQSAQERYEAFIKEFPEIIQSVPLHYIASFLGVSPETLSRVRKAK
jgi:CRP-like cAMP-binding protein